jgi:16S rRNA (cytosine1402-N4)-methyltransferase
MDNLHQPVLLDEAITLLGCRSGGIYIDGTIGEGGHACRILQSCPDIRLLIGIDRDEEALNRARKRLAPFGSSCFFVKGNYSQIKAIIADMRIRMVDGVILDLGSSTQQFLSPQRGFSFQQEGPLDMRMDKDQKATAGDLINTLPQDRLKEIFSEYGEEKWSSSIARSIVRRRKQAPIETTTELADLVSRAIPPRSRPHRIHPATRTFQALRIAVNDELSHLQNGLPDAIDALAPEGRIAVISFHSLEDRIVKRTFRHHARTCICPPDMPQCSCGHTQQLRMLTKKPIIPEPEEISKNLRSRSARLRGAEKI